MLKNVQVDNTQLIQTLFLTNSKNPTASHSLQLPTFWLETRINFLNYCHSRLTLFASTLASAILLGNTPTRVTLKNLRL